MIVCNSILQANGFVNLPIIVMFLGSIVKLSVNYYLVGKPEIGIKGAPVGTLLCFAIIALLELVVIKRVVPYAPRYGRVFLKPLAAALVMGAAVRIIYSLLSRLLSAAGFITDAGVLSRTETRWAPFSPSARA
jgi:stage V sporulation protein B